MSQPVFESTRPRDYLQRLAASGLGRAYKDLAVSKLGIGRGDVLLELGCGPGADLTAFAGAVGRDGRVIGVDHDPGAVREAAGRASALPQVAVLEGDIHALALPDASVDRAHTDRVLQHVADPAVVLAEVRRVVRAGGGAVFAEPDWDTLIIDYPDVPIAQAYTRFVTDRVVRNARIGRQLPRLAQRAGFVVTDVAPVTAVFRDARAADQVFGLERVTGRAVAAGYLTAQAARDWLGYLADQPFFASSTLYIVSVEAD